jgi:hypothetical protein
VCVVFEIFKVKVPIIFSVTQGFPAGFSGTQGFPARRDGR